MPPRGRDLVSPFLHADLGRTPLSAGVRQENRGEGRKEDKWRGSVGLPRTN